jgi:hypothetical protein
MNLSHHQKHFPAASFQNRASRLAAPERSGNMLRSAAILAALTLVSALAITGAVHWASRAHAMQPPRAVSAPELQAD